MKCSQDKMGTFHFPTAWWSEVSPKVWESATPSIHLPDLQGWLNPSLSPPWWEFWRCFPLCLSASFSARQSDIPGQEQDQHKSWQREECSILQWTFQCVTKSGQRQRESLWCLPQGVPSRWSWDPHFDNQLRIPAPDWRKHWNLFM